MFLIFFRKISSHQFSKKPRTASWSAWVSRTQAASLVAARCLFGEEAWAATLLPSTLTCPFNQDKFYLKIVIFCTFSGDFFAIFKLFAGRVLKREKREDFNFLCFGLAKNMFAECAEIGILLCIIMLSKFVIFGTFHCYFFRCLLLLAGCVLLCWAR